MRIIHAVCDENGRANGGAPGDQTGKEILEAAWYVRKGGWTQYLECVDRALAEHAVTIARAIAKGNYGYSQDAGKNGRWSGYDAILEHGIENGVGNFDCSSLVLSCYRLAGLKIKEKAGSTHDLADRLLETGKFALVTSEPFLSEPEYAAIGGIYCTPGAHTCICIEDGAKYQGEEVPERELIRAKGSIRIRETPKTGKTLAIAHKGDVIEVYGTDEESGWYKTATGYITNNTRYVESV